MKKLDQLFSIIGGVIALLIATSCCWLPIVIMALGGAGGWLVYSESLGRYSMMFLSIGITLLAYGGYLLWKNRKNNVMKNETIFDSTITCPKCDFRAEETMPIDACQFYYECKNCGEILKPNKRDCCVFCSFGTIECPPKQNNNCC